MAVGDVVNGISADNTIIDYQPAAGVEAVITSVMTYNLAANNAVGLYNGTLTANFFVVNAQQPVNFGNTKIFVNNTRYLRVSATGAGFQGGYSGIQTK